MSTLDDAPVRFPFDTLDLYPPAAAPVPLAEFVAEVLTLYQPPLRSKATFIKMRQALHEAAALAGPEATTAALAPALVARFIAARPAGGSANTTVSLLSCLRTACGYAETRGYLRASPFRLRRLGQWLRTTPQVRTRLPSRAEIARVLDLLGREAAARAGWSGWRARRLHALVATVAFTGMRRNEALYLRVADVDLAGGMIAIVPRDGRRLKTFASAQPVPIPAPLAALLADWLTHRLDAPGTAAEVPDAAAARPIRRDCPWLFPNLMRSGPWTGGPPGSRPIDRIKAAGLRAGVAGFTFLALRHGFASHAEHWGLSPAMIQRILRHTTLRTQWHYRHADPDNLREAARRIDFGPATS